MTPLPNGHDIPPLKQAKTTRTAWHQMVAAISESDLITIVALFAIGLLITLNLILRFPEFGTLIESYNQF